MSSTSSIPPDFHLDAATRQQLTQESVELKVCIIGASTVGKTTLTRRFAECDFIPPTKSTINVDIARKTCFESGKTVRVEINDVAGQAGYRTLANNFFRKCGVYLLVCSLAETDAYTWEEAREWITHARSLEPHIAGGDPSLSVPIPVIVVASKCDLPNPNKSPGDIEAFARSVGASHWCMASGKQGINVDMVFQAAIVCGMTAFATARGTPKLSATPLRKPATLAQKKSCEC